ncbi:DUF6049 family protein [Kitasatospora sp. NPDC050543]|uniref:DUF6049 family protein n=1 Tax=Kitasatospora sp. NPDC050543 TaxID=3364054 RepID=UPI0037A32B2E
MGEPARHSGLEANGLGANGWRRRAGRAARRLAAAAASCTLVLAAGPQAVALGMGPAHPALASAARADAVTADTVSAEYPLIVTIDTVSPAVAAQNGTVTITGRVTNSGAAVLKSAHAAVRAPIGHKPLTTRSDLAAVAARTTPSNQDGIDLDSPQAALNELAQGQSQPFTLQVAVADLGLDQEGAYELAVDVRGWTTENQRERPLGIARTFLPYDPKPTEAEPVQVATLWPITHAPELVAQTFSDNDQSVPVLRDDSLAREFAPGGRLYELVDTGAKLNGLTWVVDPDLLDTAFAMTKTYRVQKPGKEGDPAREDTTVQGAGTAAATAWLEKLRTAVAQHDSEVVSLPYADPDLASIAHNGADLAGIDTALGRAGTAGRVTAEGRLSVNVRDDVAWPFRGLLDQQIAATAQRAGDNLLLVNGDSLPESDALKYTPGAVRPIGNGQTAVVADNAVSEPFQVDLNTPQAQTEAVQRFLAETLVISRQEPHNPRGLLVMPPRGLTVNSARTLATALQQAQNGKWVSQVKLDQVAQAAADPKANGAVPPSTDYPAEARASELSAGALTTTIGIQSNLDLLMQILTLPQRVRGPFTAAMVRSMSVEWRPDAPAGDAYRKGVETYLKTLRDAVNVVQKKVITFPGDTGILQVSVRNELTQTVTNLRLELTSNQPNRLRARQTEDLVLGPSHNVTLQFPAEAKNNGPVLMTAQLWTTGPNPQKYGDPKTFTVEVTSVTNGVLYVFGAGMVLILLAGLRFYLQRKKHGDAPYEDPDAPLALTGESGDGESGSGDASAGDGGDGSGRPGGDADEDADDAGADASDDAPPADDDRAPGEAPGGERAQTLRGSTADGEDRAVSDEKVGP